MGQLQYSSIEYIDRLKIEKVKESISLVFTIIAMAQTGLGP